MATSTPVGQNAPAGVTVLCWSPVNAEFGSCASGRRSPGTRAARSMAFTRWAAPPGARSAPSVRPSSTPWESRTSPRASASTSATRRPRSQGTVLLVVSGLAAHRYKANHLGAPVLQFFCRRHNRAPAHLASRSLASNSTVLTDPLRPVVAMGDMHQARLHHRHAPWTIGRRGVATSRRPAGRCPGSISNECAGPLRTARRLASGGVNVSQVGTNNQSG